MISLFGKAKRPLPLYKRRGTGAARYSAGCYSSKISATSFYPEKAAVRPHSLRRRHRRRLLSRLRHGSEERQGEGEGRKVGRGLRLEAMRREGATFPPQLDALGLWNRFFLFWST